MAEMYRCVSSNERRLISFYECDQHAFLWFYRQTLIVFLPIKLVFLLLFATSFSLYCQHFTMVINRFLQSSKQAYIKRLQN